MLGIMALTFTPESMTSAANDSVKVRTPPLETQ